MDVAPVIPPRTFATGGVTITHAADIALGCDEQVTFVAGAGTQLDVCRKAWGSYATSSNRRLRDHGLRMALCANDDGRVSMLLVEAGAEPAFEHYIAEQPMRVVAWLDSDMAAAEALRRLESP
ncbi:MAG: hypothetical protein WKF96_15620 [Solirubrobacteraceae bacterium]